MLAKAVLRFLGLALMLALLLPVAADGHPAIQVVDWIWKHVGGKSQFASVRYVEFTWAAEAEGKVGGSRIHKWDRYTGDYVLEFTNGETNEQYKVFFNVDTRKGVALKNGSKVDDDETPPIIDRAYRIFINDTYWLLFATKLEDPGARIGFVGHDGKPEQDGSEGEFVVLHLFFQENVGLTPGDQYWIYVTHEGQIVKWRYRLESGREGEYEWLDEKDCGMGVILSLRRVSADGKRAIVFPHVKLSRTLDRAVFEYPED
ncbi:MAG: hypothetical protein OEN01_14225 [Candidatus Krumholzibacteria bacterium]|nr:hypothetical protein [Candidatus Krumholzibacteria bacterium]